MRKLTLFLGALLASGLVMAGPVIKTVQAGATDQSVVLKIIDSTDGTPETGVVFNTSGIDLEYWRHGQNSATDITEVTQTVNGAHTDGGFVHIGHGMYRLDLPDAAVAANATAVEVYGTVTGMIVIGGTVQLNTSVPQTGDAFARLGAPVGASISADLQVIDTNVDDIETDTAVIGAAGAGLTAIPWNSSWDAEVESEANDAIVANHLDHLLAADYDPASKPGTSTALLNELVENDGGVSRFTVNALENGPSGSGASAEAIADAVWDEAQSGHVGAGTFGELASEIAAILVDTAEIGTAGAGLSAVPWNAAWDAEVQSEATDALNAYDPPTNAELTAAVANVSVDEIQSSALADLFNTDSGTTYGSAVSGSVVAEIADNAGGSALTEAGIADAVWDEVRSGHTTAGTFGEYVLASAEYWNGTEITTALEDSSDIATAVATELGNGSAFTEAGGTGDHLTAVPWNSAWDAEVESEVDDALGSGTGTALTAIPWNAAWDAEVQSEATDALNAYDPPTDTEMDAAFAALNDLSAAEVNAEVDSAIETYHLDHLLAADYDPATPPGVSTALLNELVENDAGVARFTTNSLENAPTGGGGSADWSTGEREEIRGRLGITGDTAAGGNTPTLATQASVDALNDLDAAGVRTAVGLASANLDTQLATIDGNVDDIETAVGALNDLDAAGVRAAVGLASANLDTQLATIDQNVDDIEADTADMQPKLGTPAGASLAADIAALPTAAEVRDALLAATVDGSISVACYFALDLAYSAGKWTSSGSVVTYRDPTDAANRIVGTIGATSFDSITRTCP